MEKPSRAPGLERRAQGLFRQADVLRVVQAAAHRIAGAFHLASASAMRSEIRSVRRRGL